MKRIAVILAFSLASAGAVAGLVLAQGQGKIGDKKMKNPNFSTSRKTTTRMVVPKAATKSTIPEEVWERLDARLAPADGMVQQAHALLKSGNFVGAEQACRKAIEMYEAQGDMGILGSKMVEQILGDIYLTKGEYQKALDSYGVAGRYTDNASLHLNAALCYLRLGNYAQAKRFYSDQAVLQYVPQEQRDEYHRSMPGVTSPRALEASILFARGNESTMSGRHADAVTDFEAAGTLAPNNGLIAYCTGMSLVYLNRSAEGAPYFRRAAQYGRGKIAQDAQRRAAAYK